MTSTAPSGDRPHGQNHVTCPYCEMEAPAENLLCIFCGRSLILRSGTKNRTWFFLAACILMAALIILWLLR